MSVELTPASLLEFYRKDFELFRLAAILGTQAMFVLYTGGRTNCENEVISSMC